MTVTLRAILEAGDRERVAVRAPEDGTALTARQLLDGVTGIAGELRGLGIERGDRVSLVLPNGPEFIQVLLGIAELGAAAAPLNPSYTTDEFAFYFEDLAPRVLVVPAGEAKAAREVAPAGTIVLDAEFDAGTVRLSRDGEAIESTAPYEPASPDDMALLLHTSGTTSRPKQVPLLHRNLVATSRAIAEHYALSPVDVSFSVMPLFHVHGLVASVLGQLAAGGSVIAPRRLASGPFWSSLATANVTWFSGSPTLLTMLLDQRPDDWATPSLRFVRSCSSALSSDLFERVERELGVPLLQAYGMTEASHQIASNPLPPQRRAAQTVGVPSGTEITTLDEKGHELPAGTPGEVAIRGPGITPGYLNNPDANADAFVNGWFRTGDRGVMDADGYLTLEGRIKELIIRGGENISPFEIEEVLRRHPTVVDVACFAVPDAKYGEVVGAAVIVSEPTEPKELVAFCRGSLAAFKVPKVIHVVESLPKTATGKVQRQKLVAQLEGDTA